MPFLTTLWLCLIESVTIPLAILEFNIFRKRCQHQLRKFSFHIFYALKDAPIIVFDEATAFMDPDNEEKMNRAIREVLRNKTVIVIAHRLQSILHADQICVLEKGTVTARGSHEELLAQSEAYQKLWQASTLSEKWNVRETEAEEVIVR